VLPAVVGAWGFAGVADAPMPAAIAKSQHWKQAAGDRGDERPIDGRQVQATARSWSTCAGEAVRRAST